MIPKSIDDIGISDIQVLVDNEVPERRTLDYKQDLPEDSKDGTKDFLKDVCAFANTIGGDLIYGVKEERDSEGKTTGIPQEICGLEKTNFDEFIKKYEDRIQAGIEPRIQGIRFHKIQTNNNKCVLVIRVPQSWIAPHRIIYSKMSYFYGRRNAGNYQLDIDEIRASFLASETLIERIKNFRKDRVEKISRGNTPVKLGNKSSIILHIVPLSAFTNSRHLDLENIKNSNPPAPMACVGWNSRYNFDGFLTEAKAYDDLYYGYAQLFRNGIIESVNSLNLAKERDNNCLYFSHDESNVISIFPEYLSFLKRQNFTPPIIVFLSLINVDSCVVTSGSRYPFHRINRILENDLILPEVVIRDFDEKPEDILRPLFDTVWQAGGYSKSINYDEDGSYCARR